MRTLALFFAAAALWTSSPAEAAGFQGRAGTFHVKFDDRDCLSPLCGGFWIDAVNHREQRCPDGTVATSCYVAEIDYAAMGWTEDEWIAYLSAAGSNTMLIKGTMSLRRYQGGFTLGFLTPMKAWAQWLPVRP